MGLTRSAAGVPWNYGISRLVSEETRIYTDRLAEAWARDPQRVAALERSGLPQNAIAAAWKTAAVALWGQACDQIQVGADKANWSIRQIATMHADAYKAVDRMPFWEWERVMNQVVIPMLSVGVSAPGVASAEWDDDEDDAEFQEHIRAIESQARVDKRQLMEALADVGLTEGQLDQLGWEYLDAGFSDMSPSGPYVAWIRERLTWGPVEDDGGEAMRRVRQRLSENTNGP